MNAALELIDVNKSYGLFVVQHISFQIQPGELVGFVGQNGAGKTTTIKLILDMLNKDSGEIRILGMDHRQEQKQIKERVGFVLDGNFFYEEFSPLQAGYFFASFYSRWDMNQFRTYLDQFELPGRRAIKKLSKGMQMKLALAVSLSHHAELLLLDEPTSGLDPFAREEFLTILLDLCKNKKVALLFSSHFVQDIERIAERVIWIEKGQIRWDEPLAALLNQFLLVRGAPSDWDESLTEISFGYQHWPAYFSALIDKKDIELTRLQESAMNNRWGIQPATLEDVILYTGRKPSA
jgi:ABC-2 type transport system ATP-binding protein